MTATGINFRESLLKNSVKEHGHPHLNALAANAYQNLAKLNVPRMKDDEWRFLDLTSLTGHEFAPRSKEIITADNLEQVKKLFLVDTIRIVLVNGYYSSELSDLSKLNQNLQTSVKMDSSLRWNDIRDGDDNVACHPVLNPGSTISKIIDSSLCGDDTKAQNFFTMLNQSFFAEELCLNVVGELAEKIHLLHVNVANTTSMQDDLSSSKFLAKAALDTTLRDATPLSGECLSAASKVFGVSSEAKLSSNPGVSYPRTKIVINKNCQATLIEDYISFENEVSLTNSVTEIILKEDARLNHSFIERLAKSAFYIGHSHVTLAQNATYDGNVIVHGGRLSRSDISIDLNAMHASANFYGLSLINGRQISDVKTSIKHNAPNCRSNQLHKSIVAGGAHSIFNGKICVEEGAVVTEAHQQNKSLMLSTKARITTEPKLEINNDDVVCTHGATISQIDEDILFFFKSRGIDQVEATKLCVNAFLHEIISKIPVVEIQNSLLKN